jgi:hypothetical protein
MKKQNKKQVKELAVQFEAELNRSLPISIQPNGSIVYKNFIIKRTPVGMWGLYNLSSMYLLESFQLKTCALMAAKQYTINLNKFFEIKRIDTKYWNFFSDVQVYKHNIKRTKDFDRYVILLNKLEHSEEVSAYYKEVISRMFKWTFV